MARNILILANRTAPGGHLQDLVRTRMKEGPCHFTLLVPTEPPHGSLTWTDDDVIAAAHRRMETAVEGLRALGAEVEGRVEEGPPMAAVDAFMQVVRYSHGEGFNEIVVSTLPPGGSRWLKQDLVHRLQRHYDVPVTHVISSAESQPVG